MQWDKTPRHSWHEKEFESQHSARKKQHTKPIKGNGILAERPQIGQGRAGMRRRRPSPITQTITQPSELSQKIPEAAKIVTKITKSTNSTSPAHSVNNANKETTQRRPLTTDVPFYPGSTFRPPPKPIKSPMERSHEGSQSSDSTESTEIDSGINIDFEEIPHSRKELFQKLIRYLITHSF